MAVVDRWHKTYPGPSDQRCRDHRQASTSVHGHGQRWQVRWRDESGRQRKRNFARKTGGDPNKCADAFDAKVRDQLNAGTYVDPAMGKTPFRVYAEQWRASLTSDPHTRMQVESRLRVHVYPRIGDTPMGVLARRPSLIQQWIKGLEVTLAASTIRGIVSLVSTVFSAAVDDQVVPRNPVAAGSVRPPRSQARKVVPWDLATVEAMGEALDDRYSAMVYLGAGCAHRQGELFAVAVEDIDFLGRMVHVRRQVRIIEGQLVFSLPKGRKERSVPLPESVGLRLSAHIAEHGTIRVALPWGTPAGQPVAADLLFTTRTGCALDRNTFNRWWRDARKAAGVADGRDNGCHKLRHTAASAWLAQGVDVRTVAEYLGHANASTTLGTYAHLMPDASDRARRAMDAFFQGETSPSALDVPGGGTS